MLLFSLIPVSFLVVIYLYVLNQHRNVGNDSRIRVSFLKSTLLFCLYLVSVTELLSHYNLIIQKWILAAWVVPVIIFIPYLVIKGGFVTGYKITATAIVNLFSGSWIPRLLLFVIAVSFLIAITYPPNNWDSLTYHMARVAHWVQNQNIEYYSTHILRQLVFPPFAEWVILHFQILVGNDRLANAVQLFFFIGCISNVSLIVMELGGSFKQQLLGALFCGLIPMAVIQSNTTQNDIVVAFFVSAFVYMTLKAFKGLSYSLTFFLGIALGLSWFAKGTGYFYTGLFCFWFFVLAIKKFSFNRAYLQTLLMAGLIPIIALSINSGYYYRNLQFNNHPLGNAGVAIVNEEFRFIDLSLVGVKNILNHMPMTGRLKRELSYQTGKLGIDVNDPRFNYTDLSWMKEGFSFNEDYAQNFVHTVLIIGLGILWIYRRKAYHKFNGVYMMYGLTLFAYVFLFSIVFKWQPWSNRLETTLFMLFSAFIALEIGGLKKWVAVTAQLSLIGFGIGALLWSSNHRLMPPKKSILFRSYDSYLYDEQHRWCINYIKANGYTNIGLYIGSDDRDYIFYKLLMEDDPKRKIQHVIVRNESAVYKEEFYPEVIISSDEGSFSMKIGDTIYVRKVIFMPRLAVFVREDIFSGQQL